MKKNNVVVTGTKILLVCMLTPCLLMLSWLSLELMNYLLEVTEAFIGYTLIPFGTSVTEIGIVSLMWLLLIQAHSSFCKEDSYN